MFYKMIEAKRNEWLASETCTVKAVIDYIVKTGQMRDAQVEAIKTYLFLKIACSCKPLAELFYEGAFNTLDLDDSEVSHSCCFANKLRKIFIQSAKKKRRLKGF